MTRLAALTLAALMVGCSSDATQLTDPGTPGAGVATAITSVESASGGYSVRFSATNRDTASVGYQGCAGAVELAVDSGWIRITGYRPCFDAVHILQRGSSTISTIWQQQIDHGARIRVAFYWNYAIFPDSGMISTSEPVVVP